MYQIHWLWNYMGKKRYLFVWGLVISFVSSSILIVNPFLSQKLIDEVITPQDTRLLLPILAGMMAVHLSRLAMRYTMVVFLEKSSQEAVNGIRRRMYDVIQNQDYRFSGRMRTGNLMTRMTSDLDMVRHALAGTAYVAVDCVVIFIAAFTFLMFLSVPLTLSLVAVTPFILIITRRFSRRIRPMYVKLREKLTTLSTMVQENIAGNRVVKAFAQEQREEEKFDKMNDDYRSFNVKTSYVNNRYQPILSLLAESLTIITLVLGGIFMINGSLTMGEYLAFSSLTWALANPMRTLGVLISDVQRFFASCNMVIEVFYSQPSIVDRQDATAPAERIKGEVELKNVSFEAAGKKVLDNVSFRLEPGQTLGILGSTGAGKTSLINMLMRFYEPSEGKVLLDGKSVDKYTLSSLRRSMGLAMQDVFLFSETVAENIAYGRPELEQAEIEKRAVQADADSFISKMDEGYDTLIGERGVGISGGQKQRISLARALAVKPSVLILDDTTSAVDMETEKYIQGELRALDYPCTNIIVAQRVSSFTGADLIIVMDEGRIIERGTHEELMAQQGAYFGVWMIQNDQLERQVS